MHVSWIWAVQSLKPLPFQQTCPFDVYLQSQYRHEDFRPSAPQLLDLPANKSVNFPEFGAFNKASRHHGPSTQGNTWNINWIRLLQIRINLVHPSQRQLFCSLKSVSLPSINLIEMVFSINSLLNSGFQHTATYDVEAPRGINGKSPATAAPTTLVLH